MDVDPLESSFLAVGSLEADPGPSEATLQEMVGWGWFDPGVGL